MTANEPHGRVFTWLSSLLIIVAGLVAYANSFGVPFLFDDHPSITDNPYVRHFWPPTMACRAPPQVAVTGRPVVSLTLAMNYAVDGLNVRGYHVFNLVAHIAAGLLLYGIVRRTIPKARPQSSDSMCWSIALATALIWVVHPLQTETVTYVSNRTELLMGMFYFATLWCSIRALDSNRHATYWNLLSVGCCALGMGCKEVMASAPLIVLIYDRLFAFRDWRTMFRKRRWLYAGLALTWVLLAFIVASEPRTHSVGFDLGVSPWHYLLTQAGVIVQYVRLCIWPSPLIIYYDWPIVIHWQQAALPGVLIVLLIGGTAFALWKRHWLGFLGAWFFLILAPSSSVLPLVTEIVAERRMYLPSAAVLLAIITGAAMLIGRMPNATLRRFSAVVLMLIATTTLGAATIRRNVDYRSELAIWMDTAAKSPNSAWAHNNLAAAMLFADDVPGAEKESLESIRLDPRNAEAHTNLGVSYERLGRIADAIDQYRQALDINPNVTEALTHLANILVNSGGPDEAEPLLRRAVESSPTHLSARLSLASMLRNDGRTAEALQHYQVARRYWPNDFTTLMSIGALQSQRSEFASANDAFARAVRIQPQDSSAWLGLGTTFIQLGRFDAAIESLEHALQIDPNSIEVQQRLGTALAKSERWADAADRYRHLLELEPHSAETLNNLGMVLARQGQFEQAMEILRKALLLKPDYDVARINLAETLSSLATQQSAAGQKDQAVHLLQQAIDLANAAKRSDAAASYQRRLDELKDGAGDRRE